MYTYYMTPEMSLYYEPFIETAAEKLPHKLAVPKVLIDGVEISDTATKELIRSTNNAAREHLAKVNVERIILTKERYLEIKNLFATYKYSSQYEKIMSGSEFSYFEDIGVTITNPGLVFDKVSTDHS